MNGTPESRAGSSLDLTPDACVLALVGVVASRDGRLVLDDVTLPVARGRITVLVGPSAVGKTTCVRHLVGLDQPSHGRALIEGRDIAEMPVRELRRQRRRMIVMLQG